MLRKCFCDRRQQRSLGDVPHRDRQAEGGGAAGERAGRLLGQDLELIDTCAHRPGESRAETAGLPFVEQHPTGASVDGRGSERERHRLQVAARAVITGQRSELHRQQSSAA